MWHSRLPLVTFFVDLPGQGHTYPWLFYNDHMDNLPAAIPASPPFLWYSFLFLSADVLCLHLGLIFTQESFTFEMINYNIEFLSTTLWHFNFLPEFSKTVDPFSSSGAWLQTSFSMSISLSCLHFLLMAFRFCDVSVPSATFLVMSLIPHYCL